MLDCGVWSMKSSAKSASKTSKSPLLCTSSVFRRTTSLAASLADCLLMISLQLVECDRTVAPSLAVRVVRVLAFSGTSRGGLGANRFQCTRPHDELLEHRVYLSVVVAIRL